MKNGVSFRVGHRIVEAFPRFLKLEQLACDFRAKAAGRRFGIFDHAVEFQRGAQQPLALELVLRKLFWGRFLLNNFPILPLKIIVDGFNPRLEKPFEAWRVRRRSVRSQPRRSCSSIHSVKLPGNDQSSNCSMQQSDSREPALQISEAAGHVEAGSVLQEHGVLAGAERLDFADPSQVDDD